MKRLIKYLKGYYVASILAPALKLCEALLELAIPLLVGQLIDSSQQGVNQAFVVRNISWMIVIALLSVAMAVVAQYLSAVVAVGVTQRIADDVVAHAMKMARHARTEYSSNKILSRVTNDTMNIQNGLNLFFRLLLRSPFIVGGAVVMCWRLNAGLSLYVIVMVMMLSVIIGFGMYILAPHQRVVRVQFERLVKIINEQLNGLKVIRVFNRVDDAAMQFDKHNTTYHAMVHQLNWLSYVISPLTFVVVNAFVLIILYQGQLPIQSGALSAGQLVAFIHYVLQILIELVKMLTVTMSVHRAVISMQRIDELLATPVLSKEVAIEQSEGSHVAIELTNVEYTYPHAKLPALRGVSFAVREGETIGIIGGTGSGKTTLANVIVQSLCQTQGQIRTSLSSMTMTRSDWRQHIVLVTQQPQIFAGSIRDNVSFGVNQLDESCIWHALEVAQLAKYVEQLPLKLDTIIEPYGNNLSGGQKQRLSLARAIAQQPKVLIIDDALSGLDGHTLHKVLSTLQTIPNLTLVLIAQQVSSIRECDMIVVLEQGMQVANGTHEELCQSSEVYREIVRSQQEDDAL